MYWGRPSKRPRIGDRSRRSSGFTLIELLVVVSVIAVLAAMVAPAIFRNVGDAKVAAARADIEAIGLALDGYALHTDHYPSSAQGLAALVTTPTGNPPSRGWRGPYLKKGVPFDPWGNPYHYESPGRANPTSYDLVSYGHDGRLGGSGQDEDLLSWRASPR